MARKKSERKAKTFSEAIGINYIINDKTGFFLGLILLFFSVFVILALISYFSTGQADQSLVEACGRARWKTVPTSFKTLAVLWELSYPIISYRAASAYRLSSFPSLSFCAD